MRVSYARLRAEMLARLTGGHGVTRTELFESIPMEHRSRAERVMDDSVRDGTVHKEGEEKLADVHYVLADKRRASKARRERDAGEMSARPRAREHRVAGLARDLFIQYWPLIITADSDEELAQNCFMGAEAFEALADKRLRALQKKTGTKKS